MCRKEGKTARVSPPNRKILFCQLETKSPSLLKYLKQRLPELDEAAVLGADLDDLAVLFRDDVVHQFHRLDDAESVSLFDLLPHKT